jgi:hypothetical protein
MRICLAGLLWLVRAAIRLSGPAQRKLEDGHDRAERRERDWYGKVRFL